jgi:hypothetical protein
LRGEIPEDPEAERRKRRSAAARLRDSMGEPEEPGVERRAER